MSAEIPGAVDDVMYLVIIERQDDDPEAVVFEDRRDALIFREEFNAVAEVKWPMSFHNYARVPQEPLTVRQANRLLDEKGEDE
jgi:hypothetical protein